jgi:signal transduction histidine kinase
MNLFTNPFHQKNTTKDATTISSEADKIVAYTIELVNREDLIVDLVDKYHAAKNLSKDQQEQAFIPVYIGLEAFIIKNKPLIVKQEWTKEQLRDLIRKQFDITGLSPAFGLVFLLDGAQNALLYELCAQKLATFLKINIGLPHLKAAYGALKEGKARNVIRVTDQGLNFDTLNLSLSTISEEDVLVIFKEIYQVILAEIKKSVSPTIADKVITDIFDDIRKTYDYDLIAKFLDVLPEGVLENERIRRLGRDELEGKIQSRTRELDEARKQVQQKLDLIKKQNDELAKAKQDLLHSLDEEKRLEEEIKKEKTQVEEKVKERTAELNAALENLKVSYQQTESEKARLLASVNNLSLGFVMTDSTDSIIAMNKISNEILKSSEKQFTNIQELHEYLKEYVNLLNLYQKCKNEKVSQNPDTIKMGSSFLKLFFTPIMQGGLCIGVVVLIEDISEAKLLERSKDEFFAVASHELRTPLTAIRGYTSLILDNYHEQIKGEPTLVTMISNMHASSIRLIKIVNTFLDASKIEQGKMTFNTQPFSPAGLIESVVTDLTQLASEKHITLTFDNKEEMPEVSADQERVKQVLYNLIGNSIKFTEKGGVTVSIQKMPDHVKVLVKDTGLGVSDEYRQLLFRKFQQAGERILTRDAATGSGMGLYISKLIIEAMKGSITIEETKLGEGSTFAFTLPVAKSD